MKVFSAEVDSGDDSTDNDLDSESNDNEITDNTACPVLLQTLDLAKSEAQGQKNNIFITKSMYVSYIV